MGVQVTKVDLDPDWDEFIRLIETKPNICLMELKNTSYTRAYVVMIEMDG